ncbi:hypothetical protein B1729_03480 [Microbacterium sp. B35-04]|nr:hypothetical protein B1729_03480 [Microbacterium sp. B35-04]
MDVGGVCRGSIGLTLDGHVVGAAMVNDLDSDRGVSGNDAAGRGLLARDVGRAPPCDGADGWPIRIRVGERDATAGCKSISEMEGHPDDVRHTDGVTYVFPHETEATRLALESQRALHGIVAA